MIDIAPTLKVPSLRRSRLVDDVTRELREMILSGKLRPGTQLLQVELAEQLGISRTPLREAFRVLENDGLLRSSDRNRTVEVVTIDSAELKEMYEVREVIDGLAARLLAIKGMSEELSDELSGLLEEMEAASRPYDPARRTAAHGRFHALIAENCGNEHVASFVPLIRQSSAALYTPFIGDSSAVALVDNGTLVTHRETLDTSENFHREIFNALREGNSRKAETTARRHIAGTLRWVGRLDEWKNAITLEAARF